MVCTIPSLPVGALAVFELTYIGGAGGSTLASTATATTTTQELDTTDNTSTAPSVRVSGGDGAPVCSLECPENMFVNANTTQGETRGAIVNFAVEPTGSCGAVTSTPASGTFFPVGTTPVSTSSASGGGACSFTVTVAEAAAPTISCPPNVSVEAGTGESFADVSPGTPQATGNNISVSPARSDNQPVGDPYPVGTTTIVWTVTDADNRTATCSQTVTVTTPSGDAAPTIECPADISEAAAEGACSKTVSVGAPTVTGTGVSTSGERSDNLAVSAPYPAGTTIITWTVSDSFSRTASCTQSVTVTANDTTNPTVTAPSNRTFTTDSCSIILDDQLGSPNGSDNCSNVTITTSGIPAGNEFPVGTTTLTYTATDAAGNTSAPATQIITVLEDPSIPPTITAPAAVTVSADAGSCAATGVALGTPTTADNCSVGSVTNNAPASFPVGNTTVTWTVTDNSGNSATATQLVTVNDNENPTIVAPAAKTFNTGPGATSCNVTLTDADLGTATANDNCPGVTVARDGGNVFPLGNTTVTYTATDAHGHTATATQIVTVVDNTLPVITPPANVVVNLPLNSPATSMVVNYNPATATDNCGGVNLGYSPVSGSVFPVGTTTVTVTGTDTNGNINTATFTVTVLYNFTGFFSPVDNLPTLNVVQAGKAIPVKFSLSGNKGLNIFAANSPYTVSISCDGSVPQDDVEETLNAGGSSLNYDAASDQYNYVWKTESSWKNTCRQLVVKLNDGSLRTATFKFK